MKKILLGTVGLVALGFAAPASAADLAARPYTKAPPPMVAALYDWSGFYIGANGGWGSSRNCWDLLPPFAVVTTTEGCHDATGGVAGGQIGYRWQASSWVFGLEAQGDWADLRGSNASQFFAGQTNRTKVDAFGLFTGQIGYAWNNALLYVKGGAAVTDNRYNTFTRRRVSLPRAPAIRPAGVALSAPASNSASRRTGRRRSNTTTCSCRIRLSTSRPRPVCCSRPTASARTSISSPFA